MFAFIMFASITAAVTTYIALSAAAAHRAARRLEESNERAGLYRRR